MTVYIVMNFCTLDGLFAIKTNNFYLFFSTVRAKMYLQTHQHYNTTTVIQWNSCYTFTIVHKSVLHRGCHYFHSMIDCMCLGHHTYMGGQNSTNLTVFMSTIVWTTHLLFLWPLCWFHHTTPLRLLVQNSCQIGH